MANMIPISTVTVGSGGASSIDFVNIPQIYTDLKIVISGRQKTSTSWIQNLSFNGVTTNLSSRYIASTGSAISSSTNTDIPLTVNGSDATTNTFGNAEIYIPNYTSSNNKSFSIDVVTENNATAAYARIMAGLWSNTATITQITISSDYTQYSSATLYGIRKY